MLVYNIQSIGSIIMKMKNAKILLMFVSTSILLTACSILPRQTDKEQDLYNSDIEQSLDPDDIILNIDTVDISDVEDGKMYQEIKYQVVTYKNNEALQKSLDVLNAEMKAEAYKFKEENRDGIKEFIKETGMEDAMYSFTEDINFTRHDDKYLSLTEFVYENLMGAHGNYIRRGHTYDVKTGKKLELMDFVRDKEELRTFLKDWIKENDKDGEFFPEAQDVVDDYLNGEFDLQFNINQDSLYVVFQTYDIAPYAVGLIEVKIDDKLLKEKIQ